MIAAQNARRPTGTDGSAVDRDERRAQALARAVLPGELLRPSTIAEVRALPSFFDALGMAERRLGTAVDTFPAIFQKTLVERRLHQLVEVCRVNPLWRDRIDAAIGKQALASFEDFQRIPATDKETARQFFTGERPGMVVPIASGGFQVATSGGTASGQPTEIVYPLDELHDTYRWSGAFIGRHVVDRFMPRTTARWVACTLADHMMWSSSSMVGGVLQNIPNINFIGAGAIDREVCRRILAYPGSKAIMGISRSIAELVDFAEHADAAERASLRIALYGSGAMQPKVHADLHAAYPNLVVLSFFAAMQAEAIGLQLNPASPVLTAIPGLHFIEIVDENDRWVEVGEEGDLLVTRLFGNGAPVLRYRLGDRVRRHPDRISGELNALCFEYVGRSGDVFAVGTFRAYAPQAIASISETLRNRGLVDLERTACDVQIRLDHGDRRLRLVASCAEAADMFPRIEAESAASAIASGLARTCPDTRSGAAAPAEEQLRSSGYRFELLLVPPGSPELHMTEVGKTPLLVEQG